MNTYKIIYQLYNGYEGEEFVLAANRTIALEIFEEFDYFKEVITAECFLVEEDDDEEYNPLKENLTHLLELSEQILTIAYDTNNLRLECLAHEIKTTVDFMIEDYDV